MSSSRLVHRRFFFGRRGFSPHATAAPPPGAFQFVSGGLPRRLWQDHPFLVDSSVVDPRRDSPPSIAPSLLVYDFFESLELGRRVKHPSHEVGWPTSMSLLQVMAGTVIKMVTAVTAPGSIHSQSTGQVTAEAAASRLRAALPCDAPAGVG